MELLPLGWAGLAQRRARRRARRSTAVWCFKDEREVNLMTDNLSRRMSTKDAVVVGLGAMIGAGIFSAFAPAAAAAGASLLVGLVIAAFVAYCNATSSAQLAAVYPTSGGTYIYGRERLGAWWGFIAGWGFVIGKTASCAAMALTFAAYLHPDPGLTQRLLGVGGVLALAAVTYRGITKTAAVARVLVALTIMCLAVFVVALWSAAPGGDVTHGASLWSGGWYGVLQSAGLLFFAFAGYARIATMGEEVRDPARAIPRAIQLALLLVVVLYAVVGVTVLAAAGPVALAGSSAPLLTAADAAGRTSFAPVIVAGGAVGSLGVLLALLAGIGRTSLAMSRHGDLPAWFGAVHPRFSVPHHAELALAAVVCAIVLAVDLRGAIGFSSFGVLTYYLIANVAAYTQPDSDRRWPRGLQVAGALGCLILLVTLPVTSVLTGVVVVAIGVAARVLLRLRRPRRSSGQAYRD